MIGRARNARTISWDNTELTMRRANLPRELKRHIQSTVQGIAETHLAVMREDERPPNNVFRVINPQTKQIISRELAERVKTLKRDYARTAGHEDQLLLAPALERAVWEHYPAYLRKARMPETAQNRAEDLLAVMGEYAKATDAVLNRFKNQPFHPELRRAVSNVVPKTHFRYDERQVAQAIEWTRKPGVEDPASMVLKTLETQGHDVVQARSLSESGGSGLVAALGKLMRYWYGRAG